MLVVVVVELRVVAGAEPQQVHDRCQASPVRVKLNLMAKLNAFEIELRNPLNISTWFGRRLMTKRYWV